MTTFIFTIDDEVECPECLGDGEVEYEFNVIDQFRGGEIVCLVRTFCTQWSIREHQSNHRGRWLCIALGHALRLGPWRQIVSLHIRARMQHPSGVRWSLAYSTSLCRYRHANPARA